MLQHGKDSPTTQDLQGPVSRTCLDIEPRALEPTVEARVETHQEKVGAWVDFILDRLMRSPTAPTAAEIAEETTPCVFPPHLCFLRVS